MINVVNIPYGWSHPLGSTCYPEGVNFSIFSKNAYAVDLLLFDRPEDAKPARVIRLDPKYNRTFYYWHIFVNHIKPGQLYGYRIFGPEDISKGHYYDRHKLILDPYSRAVSNRYNYDRKAASKPGNNFATALKSVVADPFDYDWEGDRPIQRPYSESIIYEMHVKGFTAHPNSGVAKDRRGTYSGLIAKIPYLKELGITAVELMPVQHFDEQDARPPLHNYWGYSPIALFAPHTGYSKAADDRPLEVLNEFRDMVKAFHKAGIEVILDVVFNHTAEAGADGPVISLKGLENKAYYIIDPKTLAYNDYTGCGNTLNANHSIVRRMIMDCLQSWVTEFHVDGFRFDLASVLSRDEYGVPLENPPVLWEIESNPVLAGTKIIAEAWDAAGLYQVGSFIGDRWAEWNGKYRDHVRRFVKGDRGMVSKMASKLIGSPDLFVQPDREPNRSIHFVTCHDGFTLMDLVSYNRKHNEANLEGQRDGANENHSWNCGVEGNSKSANVNQLRMKQVRNFITILFFSQGTPMLLMGDEAGRTQKGNNNAYCQDNEVSWFDWSLLEKNNDLLRFTKGVIRATQALGVLRVEKMLATCDQADMPHICWHGTSAFKPDWGDNSHALAFTLVHPKEGERLHVMMNFYWESLEFELPPLNDGKRYRQLVNTALAPPLDFTEPRSALFIDQPAIKVAERSIVVLFADGSQKLRESYND
ncbi:MAG: glycogen debranching protein GlgX [Cyclobacteriaceae bacterium]|nr:glycogen debranching protein GlgX [Cyclobacteriaceae bacterium]